MNLHANLVVSDLDELVLHDKACGDLHALKKQLRQSAAKLLDGVSDGTPEAKSAEIEATDAHITIAAGRVDEEFDRRESKADRSPRKYALWPELPDVMTSKRVDASDYCLRSDQSYVDHLAARMPMESADVGLGGYLRSMVVGAKSDVEYRASLRGDGTSNSVTGLQHQTGIPETAYNAALTAYAPFVTAHTGLFTNKATGPFRMVIHPRYQATIAGLTATDHKPPLM